MTTITRAEHLEWCKKRALEYVDAGDLPNAVASMKSDMNKHEETANYPHVLDQLAVLELMKGDVEGIRRWITGFN